MIKRILVAEDDPNDVFFFQRAFDKAGLNLPLHFVADGQFAIDYLSGAGAFSDRSAHPLPDVVFVDINMPRINGFQVLEWVRAQLDLRRIPVIVISSSSLVEDINRAYDLGANSYLKKTGDWDVMLRTAKQIAEYWGQTNIGPCFAAA